MSTPSPTLARHKHITYWLRCLKTCLPTAYTATDNSRLSLSFFILSALDLLGCLDERTSSAERESWADWIYNQCQLPTGGFRGSPATATFHPETGELMPNKYDVANLPACYFALSCLVLLGDDLSRVDRPGMARLLRRLQRSDGGFGEWALEGGFYGQEGEEVVMGGDDMRYVYCAAAVRWILGGKELSETGRWAGEDDVDVDKAVEFIASAKVWAFPDRFRRFELTCSDVRSWIRSFTSPGKPRRTDILRARCPGALWPTTNVSHLSQSSPIVWVTNTWPRNQCHHFMAYRTTDTSSAFNVFPARNPDSRGASFSRFPD